MPDRAEPSRDPLRTVEPVSAIATTNSGEHGERTPTGGATVTRPRDGTPQIAGYVVEAEIARGGMGRVYRGRELALDREVAIKTLLPGAQAERFVIESKITARLPHPGIPPVYALGSLADGVPFLAMKLIRGRTLADILKERASPADDLPRFVQIFEQIAQAVGFAHAQGIIHRDLKPNNVMVGTFGEVQVMDWGLAKDLAQADQTIVQDGVRIDIEHTQSGSVLGTPGYMPPEQARGEIVDARADVFALGSVLAAILTGKPAFGGTTLKEVMQKSSTADLADVRQRLAASGADAELVALATHCLAPVAVDRPANAEAVAAQVAAYRAGVEQRVREAETRAAEALVREAEGRKRRRMQFVAGSALLAVLLLGVLGFAFGMYRANEARKVALHQEGLARSAAAAEKAANEQSKRRLTQIERQIEILASLLMDANPRLVHKEESLYERLAYRAAKAADELDDEAVGDPLSVAHVQTALGNTLRELGNQTKAIEVLEKAYQIRARELGPDHRETLTTMNMLGAAYQSIGQVSRAVEIFEQTVAGCVKQLGPNDPTTLRLQNNLALAYGTAGRYAEAVKLLEQVHQAQAQSLGPDHPDALNSLANLAGAYRNAGQSERASQLREQAYQARSKFLPEDHPDQLVALTYRAAAYREAGEPLRAIEIYEEAWRRGAKQLGADHPDMLAIQNNQALAHQEAGQLARAIAIYEQVRDALLKKQGPDHPATLNVLNNLAGAYEEAGRLPEAIAILEKVRDRQIEILGPDHPDTLTTLNNLAAAYGATEQFPQAIELYEKALRGRNKKLGPQHPASRQTYINLAFAYRRSGEPSRGLEMFKELYAADVRELGAEHETTLVTLSYLAEFYGASGELEQSLALFREHIDIQRQQSAAKPHRLVSALVNTGRLLTEFEQPAVAEELLREALAITERIEPDAWMTFHTQSLLGNALLRQQKYAEAEPLLLKGYAGLKAREARIPPHLAQRLHAAIDRLVALYFDTDKPEELAKWQAERAKYPK